MKRLILMLVLCVAIPMSLSAQRAMVTTDPLKWATLSPNVSFDVALSGRMTFNIESSFNPLEKLTSNLGIKHIEVSPELRYWFKRPYYSHYVGANLTAFVCDLRYKENRHTGQMAVAGVSYGYAFPLADRWSLVPSMGVGWGVACYFDKSYGKTSTTKYFRDMIIPVRFGLSLGYIIN